MDRVLFAPHDARLAERLGLDPAAAACVLASVATGRIVTVPAGAHSSRMAGLHCGTPSSVAWPAMPQGMDVFVAVPDERVVAAMELGALGGAPAAALACARWRSAANGPPPRRTSSW